MSNPIYLVSVESAGKTALSVALGQNLLEKGRKVGYFIPVEISTGQENEKYRDANFVKEVLNLADSVGKISPIHLSAAELWKTLTENGDEFLRGVKDNYNQIARDRDVVLIEGINGLVVDGVATLACYKVAETLKAKVIVVLRYSDNLHISLLDRIRVELGGSLAGVIINFVPADKMEKVKIDLVKKFEAIGVKVLALIPENRELLGVTVAELAKNLGGEIVTARDKTSKMVENVMLGALSLDSGTSYLSRKNNKAVIVRSERADIQLAALETSVACLVLTGNTPPIYQVVNQAEDKQVPVLVVHRDTEKVINDLEKTLINSAFNNRQKITKFQQLIKQSTDFKVLYQAVGLAG